MRRTRLRPLPDARLHPQDALWFGIALSAVGLAQLTLAVNVLAAAVAAVTLLSYVWMYTPLKPRTSLSTVVGAIPGALPAVLGWAAATNSLSAGGWILFGIVFMWQMPHFLAIAWLFREDYANAGFPLLPVVEPDGRSTGRQTVLYAAGLLPISLLPMAVGMASAYYVVGAITLGAILMVLSLEFAASRSMPSARRLFYGTILYLPLLWIVLLADHFRNVAP
jgi:protoheme IX farnesyltransferase